MVRDWKQEWEGRAYARTKSEALRIPHAFFFGHRIVYLHLPKALTSVLIQARSGKIGLAAFLHHRGVPEFPSPSCPCQLGAQTVEHLFIECISDRSDPCGRLRYTTVVALHRAMSSPVSARAAAEAILETRWLAMYDKYMRVSREMRLNDETAETLL